MKRLFSCLLALSFVLMLSAFVPTVWAEEASDNGSAGDAVTWTLDSKGILTISGTGEMTSRPWLADYAKVIKKVVIEEGVTSIYDYAFDECSSLSSVDIPSSVTEIGNGAFSDCVSLESVVIPAGVTYLDWYCFGSCSSLKEVTFLGEEMTFDISPFGSSNNIENVYVPDLESWCALDFSDAGLQYDNLYVNGEKITDLVIPEGITEVSASAFDGWTSLESVTVPESVTNIGRYAFNGCTSLKEINLSDGITAIRSNAFGNCSALESLTIPASVLCINSNAFECGYNYTSALNKITFLGNAPMFAADAFKSVNATVSYSANNASWTEDVLQNYGGTITWKADSSIPGSTATGEVITVDSGTCGESVTWMLDSKGVLTISGSGAMTDRPWLTDYAKVIKEVVIEEGVTSVYDYAFDECSSLSSVDIPSSVTEIGNGAFSDCVSLESIVIPAGVTHLDWYCFGSCSSLKEVTFLGEEMTFDISPFGSSNNIESVYVPDLESWCALDFSDAGLQYDNLYVNGEKITDLVIPEGITEVSASAFDGWTSLESVTVPESVTNIGRYAFNGCTSLKEINLSDGITAIRSNAFGNCSSLESLTLPRSILVVDSNAFQCGYNYTSVLKEIRFMGDAPLIASDAFTSVTATVSYSASNASWTEDVLQNYGGAITWQRDSSIPGSTATGEVITVDSGTCGESVTWMLDSKGVLTISGSGEMTSRPWLADYAKVIKKVVIEEGVSSVYDYAFDECSSLSSVDIPSSVTEIGNGAFSDCVSLESIVIPAGVTHLDWYCFGSCSSLKEVTFLGEEMTFDISPFGSSNNIENVYVPDLESWCALDFSDAGLQYDNLYVKGEKITDLVIPEGITEVSASAFDGWTSLESVTVPESVTNIGRYAFNGCTSLKEINLSDGITAIRANAFGNCSSLESLTLPRSILVVDSNAFQCGYNYTSVLKEIRFMGDAPLIASDAFTSVTATVYYSASNSSWTDDLFQNYGGTITWQPDSRIPGTGEEPEITIIASGVCGGNVYWELDSANVLRVYGGVTRNAGSYAMDNYADPADAPWYQYRDQIEKVVVENTVSTIGDNAFSSCENLTKVVVEENIDIVGKNAFAGCSSLEDVNFQGDVPEFAENCFGEQEIVVRYPADNETWTADVQNAVGENVMLEAHTHDYLSTVIKPTCIKDGYTKHVCVCGVSYTDNPVAAVDHKWGQWIQTKPATSTVEGEKERLCTMCGEKETGKIPVLNNPFVDVVAGKFYEVPVLWAVQNEITNGVDATHFEPNEKCSRAQVVTFLWRAAGSPEPKSSYNPFVDVIEGKFYYKAVLWAVENEITNGVDATHFGTSNECTRGQVATFLWRTLNKPSASNSVNPFSDVAQGKFYYDAVLWAVESGVTTGMGDNKFAPNDSCTRGQIVTFLYRALGE